MLHLINAYPLTQETERACAYVYVHVITIFYSEGSNTINMQYKTKEYETGAETIAGITLQS